MATGPTAKPIDDWKDTSDWQDTGPSDWTDVAPARATPPDSRSAIQVARDQAKAVLEGAGLSPLIHPLDYIKATAKAEYEHPLQTIGSAAGSVLAAPITAPYHAIKGLVTAVPNIARNAAALVDMGTAPSPEENIEAAKGAGAFGASVPVVAGEARLAAAKLPPLVRMAVTRPAVSSLVSALNPSGDLQFLRHAPDALSELKAAKTPTTSVETGLKAVDERMTHNNQLIKSIVDRQRDVPVEAYRADIVKAQKDAIPLDTDPIVRARLEAKIDRSLPPDLTIGKLDQLRSELSATQSPYYGKDTSGQLTMDASQRTVDMARGNAVRQAFYDSLDKYGVGGGQAARMVNGRVGSLIHLKDALQSKQVASAAEKLSPVGEAIRSVRMLRKLSTGTTIDKTLANAVRDWNQTPIDVKVPQTVPPTTTTGTQQPLPMTGPGGPGPLFNRPQTDPAQALLAQQHQVDIWRQGQPAPSVSTPQGELLPSGGPGMFAAPSTPVAGNPIQDYMTQQHQASLWRQGQPVSSPGQLSLFQGMTPEAEPESTMGTAQTPFRVGSRLLTPGFEPFRSYKTSSLKSLLDETNQFIRENPHHPQSVELMREVAAMRDELKMRAQGHRKP